MGLYCMNPAVFEFIPTGVPFGFDDLILLMLESGTDVRVFQHEGLWLDIGRVDDFHSAQDIAWDEQSAPVEAVAAA